MKVFNGDVAEPLKKIISEWTLTIYVATHHLRDYPEEYLNISQTEAGNVFQNKELSPDGWQWSVPWYLF